MLAREKWQVETLKVLEDVFEHRGVQRAQYGSNDELFDGTGPEVHWLPWPYDPPASELEVLIRGDYEAFVDETGAPTWLHLVREEIAEAFQESDPTRLEEELIQVAALCVSWVEQLRRRGARPLPELVQ